MPVGSNTVISFTKGFSVQPNDAGAIVKEKIKFLLLSKKGDIPNDPNYGADLHYFLFSPIDDVTQALVERTCRAEISLYLPYVNVRSVVFRNRSQGLLEFTLNYELTPGWEDYVNISLGGEA